MSQLDTTKLSFVIQLKAAQITERDKVILENVDFTLMQSEFAYLTGRTGCGKSSFITALYGGKKIEADKAEVLGTSLIKIKKSEIAGLRRRLGIVYQEMHLFKEWTVIDNLMFVLRATEWKSKTEMKIRCEEVLNYVTLNDLETSFVYELSGGQQRKLAIARALLNKPALVLADEPTGNLDARSSEEILNLFQKISQEDKTSILFATHDERIIEKYPGRVLKVEDNQLTEATLLI